MINIDDLKHRTRLFVEAAKAAINQGQFSYHISQDYVPELRRQLDKHLPDWSRRLDQVVAEKQAELDRKRR